MGQTVTLGGDRLGSGNKNKIDLHGYERSTHNLSRIWRSTTSAGTLVPFMVEVALPGDTWDVELNCDIMTHPTLGPLLGSFKAQLDLHFAPIRLYNSHLHNNELKIGLDMSQIKLPVCDFLATATTSDVVDLDNSQINPSCILKYLGISGFGHIPAILGIPNALRAMQVVPWLMYWDTYKNYYANKQEEIGAVIHSPFQALVLTITSIAINDGAGGTPNLPQAPATTSIGLNTSSVIEISFTGATPIPEQVIIYVNGSQGLVPFSALQISSDIDVVGTTMYVYVKDQYATLTAVNWDYIQADQLPILPPIVQTFPLSEIDDMRKYLLKQDTYAPVHIEDAAGPDVGLKPWSYLSNFTGTATIYKQTQEGLGIKTYQSDLFNNWLEKEWIDGTNGIAEITAIDTSGGSFTIDVLNLSKKMYLMLNRVAVSGGSYQDWMRAVYDTDGYWAAETPVYHGGLIKELVFQEIVSNAAAPAGDQGQQPLGTLAGKGVMSKKHKGGKATIKVNEPGYIMGIFSLTPRLDYSQGNRWDTSLETLDDLHKPGLDGIGFQDLITEQMAWWDTTYNLLTGGWIQRSAGKQPAWTNYMTSVNHTFGNFAIADNEMFMTLNRKYEMDWTTEQIKDLTTYIDPVKYNNIFAQTSLDAQNFWVQIGMNLEVRRIMSAKIMPNL